jgi:hypothetical protein
MESGSLGHLASLSFGEGVDLNYIRVVVLLRFGPPNRQSYSAVATEQG